MTEEDVFYVTRYMGAKYKLLDLLKPPISKLLSETQVLIDPMAGTHSVGYSFKRQNLILANDIQFYSYVFGKALIENNSISEVKDRYEGDFKGIAWELYEDSWFVRTYADTYFSEKQCVEIAAIRQRIAELEDETLRAVYLTVLANAMSLCQSSSGHFAQYFPSTHPRLSSLRAMSVYSEFVKRLKAIHISKGRAGNLVTQMDVNEFLSSTTITSVAPRHSVVYLDPPYTTAQYSRYYHILETVFLNDKPEVAFRGLYRPDRHQSPFSSPKKVSMSFEQVIELCSVNKWHLCISYSNAGLLSPSEITELCKKYYKKVNISAKEYAHSMQGRGQVNDRQEILISCEHL